MTQRILRNMYLKQLAFFLCLFLTSVAYTQTLHYRVDDRVLVFPEQVDTALGAWQAVEGGNADAEKRNDATTVFFVDNTNLLGPDTVSLSLSERTSEVEYQIILNRVEAQRARALLYEWGRVLELDDSKTGVMNPRIDPSSTLTALTDSDEALLRDINRYVSEDVNRDGVVDFYDLLLLAENFSREGNRLTGDINNDAVVNQADITLLRGAYEFLPPSQTAPDSNTNDAPAQPPLEEDFPSLDGSDALNPPEEITDEETTESIDGAPESEDGDKDSEGQGDGEAQAPQAPSGSEQGGVELGTP